MTFVIPGFLCKCNHEKKRNHPLNGHLGIAAIAKGSVNKFTPVVSNAKMKSMWIFVWLSFIFLMHNTPIKAIDYVTGVIEILC